jgi:spermidine synthase
MAVIWQKDYAGRHYEVRTAGNSVRLYTNGAFHSQYNPRHLFMGAVWDVLSLPVLFAVSPIHNVLMLGVGGGTVIHQLNRLIAPEEVTGIELDPVHLTVAHRFFSCDLPNVRLIEADALEWMRQSSARFDVVIDDIFVDADGDPERPHPANRHWMKLIERHTRSCGVVVQNYLSPSMVRKQVQSHVTFLEKHFRTALLFTTPRYDNGILALYRENIDVADAKRRATDQIRDIDPAALHRLEYRVKRLF